MRKAAHEPGRLSERLMEPVLKTGEPKGSRGSNPLPPVEILRILLFAHPPEKTGEGETDGGSPARR